MNEMKKTLNAFVCKCKTIISEDYLKENFGDDPESDYNQIIKTTKKCFKCDSPGRIANPVCSCTICRDCLKKYDMTND